MLQAGFEQPITMFGQIKALRFLDHVTRVIDVTYPDSSPYCLLMTSSDGHEFDHSNKTTNVCELTVGLVTVK
jgi:hypothetical protein